MIPIATVVDSATRDAVTSRITVSPIPVSIEPGVRSDYDALARFHYRAPRPATAVQTLRARDDESGEVIGVLIVSMPPLNAPWRELAWPDLFKPGGSSFAKRPTAQLVNTHVRTISRVVIDPRYRALGIARRLVDHYLDDPQTPCTEAVAAMGHQCPFFARAGMREINRGLTRRDVVLSRALIPLGIEPWELIEVSRAVSCMQASPTLRKAVWAWTNSCKSTRKHLPQNTEDLDTLSQLAVLAASALTAQPVVYVTP